MSTRFDFILNPLGTSGQPPENEILLETESFAVVPSLGSLVPGWLLVVPKRRVLNCSGLTSTERHELLRLTTILKDRLSVFGGKIYAFEHGSSEIGSLSGCGVDQAHLHVVPLNLDLQKAAAAKPGVSWRKYENLGVGQYVEAKRAEYLALYDCDRSDALVGKPDEPTSQWFRQLIANELKRSSEWDYRLHKGADCIRETVEAFALAK